jgi:adenylate cyclase class 2
MKKEIEVKILNKPTLFREIYWETSIKKREYSSFRLRSEGNNCFLTLKIKKDDNKFEIRDELEVKVSDFLIVTKILKLTGFKIFRQREKKREEYNIGRIKIEIDKYPYLKPYLEIEGSNKIEIKKILNKLGFSFRHTTNKTATEIILDAGLNPNYLLFKKRLNN